MKPIFTAAKACTLALLVILFTCHCLYAQDSINWRSVAGKTSNFYTIKSAFLQQYSAQIQQMAAEKKEQAEEEGEDESYSEILHFNRWAEWIEPRVAQFKGDIDQMIKNNDAGMQKAMKLKLATTSVSQMAAANWQILGPLTQTNNMFGNGRVNKITVDPANASVLYACTPASQLFKSVNGGTSWFSISDNMPAIGVTDVAIAPGNSQVLYAISGDADRAIYHPYSSGLFKSTDGGSNWTKIGFNMTQANKLIFTSIVIHPQNANIVLISSNNGIYRSTDAGASFTQVSTEPARDLAFQPGNPNVMVAGSNLTNLAKILRSTDNGLTWTGNYLGIAGRVAVCFSPVTANLVYAWAYEQFTVGGRSRAVYCSSNGGADFKQMAGTTPDMCGNQGWYNLCLAADPNADSVLYAGGIDIYKSTDSGKTWLNLTNVYSNTPIANSHPDVHDLVFSGTTLYVANDGGLYKSTNKGASFTNISANLTIAQPYGIGISQSDPKLIVSGHQDNGTNMTNDLTNWRRIFGGDGMKCFIDWNNDKTIYASAQNGFLVRSDDGGANFAYISGNWYGDNTWVTPFKQDPVNASTIYAAVDGLYRSVNKGGTWTKLTLTYSDIADFDIDRLNTNNLFYCTRNDVFKSTNGGLSWTVVTNGMTNFGAFTSIHIDVNNSNIIYAGATSYTGNNLYRSLDAGLTWSLWATGLPLLPVNCIATQQGVTGEVYCGTDFGVYHIGRNDASWSLYSDNLPPIPVRDLKIQYGQGTIRAATFGRGVWESPLAVKDACAFSLPYGRLYVKKTATGNGSGNTWANAFTSLQDALAKARSCSQIVEIWVAAGTYYTDEGTGFVNNDRNASFAMINGVSIVGGLAGNESPNFLISNRNLALNKTVLSGDIDYETAPDFVSGTAENLQILGNAGNAYHVFKNVGNGLTSTAVLDGITITGGNANSGGSNGTYGAGMYNENVSFTLRKCTFYANRAFANGGAMANVSSNGFYDSCTFLNNMAEFAGAIITDASAGKTADQAMINCTFSGNVGRSTGGAIVHGYETSNGLSSFLCNNCRFLNNYSFNGSQYGSGGAFFNQNAGFYANFINCLFDGNKGMGTDADEGGGALLVWKGAVIVTNCTFVNNKAGSKGGAARIYLNTGTLAIRNSIFWQNSAPEGNDVYTGAGGALTISNSLLQQNACPANGTCSGTNYFNTDPLFLAPAEGNYSLQPCSTGIDAGADTDNSSPLDLAGNKRTVKLKNLPAPYSIDMGAFELQVSAVPFRIYVKANATGKNDGTSWANAFRKLGSALNSVRCAGLAAQNVEIWVAASTYYPDEGGIALDNNGNYSFAPANKITLVGGFAGTETDISQRNLAAGNASILSGEIQQDNNTANNALRVLQLTSATQSIIDGFTIEQGNTSIILPESQSRGSGIAVINSGSPVIRNCTIRENYATYGPALYVENSSPQLINCVFAGNRTYNGNGAVWINNSSPTFTHCSIANNAISAGELVVVKNSSTSSPVFVNSIVRGVSPAMNGGTPIVSYSIIQNSTAWAGTGNLNSDPQFISESGNNLRLKPCSPAINAAQVSAYTTDISGITRPAAGGYDMGAYERIALKGVYVDSAASGGADGSDWRNAFSNFYQALQVYNGCAITDTLFIAKGIYTAPANTPLSISKTNAVILGGYPSGGGARNPNVNPVILKGEMRVSPNVGLKIEGVKLQQ